MILSALGNLYGPLGELHHKGCRVKRLAPSVYPERQTKKFNENRSSSAGAGVNTPLLRVQ